MVACTYTTPGNNSRVPGPSTFFLFETKSKEVTAAPGLASLSGFLKKVVSSICYICYIMLHNFTKLFHGVGVVQVTACP